MRQGIKALAGLRKPQTLQVIAAPLQSRFEVGIGQFG
jgi:hypothetical protein